MKSRLPDDKGFTLTEVIVTILIFSIVIGMVFTFLQFGLDQYTYGNNKIDEQANLRLAMLKITDEVRNCFEVDIHGTTASVTQIRYIHLNTDTLEFDDDGDTVAFSAPTVQDVDFDLKVVNGKYALEVVLTGFDSEITSEILLNNISGGDTSTAVDGTGAGKVVEFRQIP